MKKRFWAFALMVVMLISIFPVSVLAEVNVAPGTQQKIKVKVPPLEGGALQTYTAMENGKELILYCFNSDLSWPDIPDDGDTSTDIFYPKTMLHLDDKVMDKIYRILYAGYPHNNLGLYSEIVEEVDYKELSDAVKPPKALADLVKNDYDNWNELDFTPENLVTASSQEQEVMNDLSYKVLAVQGDYFKAVVADPNFLTFLYAYGTGPESVAALMEGYKYWKPGTSIGSFHDATQYAIWRILYENNVPNNSKEYLYELARTPIAKQLVDFANGEGEHKDAKIPSRNDTINIMTEYKSLFEEGSTLLRSDGSAVGKDGIVVFTKKDGEYVSEPLHFKKDSTYALPYKITLNDGTTEFVKVVNYGDTEFSLHSSSHPSNVRVTVETDDMFPSDLYQYVVFNQLDKEPEELSHDDIQDMAGVYYQSVPMALSFKTLFREEQESGNLKVTKTVNGYPAEASSKEFEFTVELSNKSINGQYGSMNFENGVATFTLQGGHFREADNLPAGIDYKVTEEDYSKAGFTTEKNGDTGTITKDQTATASFTNTYKAESVDVSLKGNKTMKGRKLSDEEFSFTITGDKVGGTVTVKNKADGSLNFGTYNFNEAGTFTFVIKEVNGGKSGVNYDSTTYNITVTVTDDGSGELKAAITGCAPTGDNINFTNGVGGGDDHDGGGGSGETSITRNGSLTISKNVTGDLGDKNKLFTFHVAFNTDNYYAYTGSKTGVIKNGGTVQLKDGESITINGIPSGVAYAIVESDNAGYRVYKTGDAGIIVAAQTLKASFTNTKSSVPQTGDNRHLFIWMGIMAISFIGCIISLVFTIRKRESHE